MTYLYICISDNWWVSLDSILFRDGFKAQLDEFDVFD